MYQCINSGKGCPRQFSSDLGKRAHIRNCIWRNTISKQRHSVRGVPITSKDSIQSHHNDEFELHDLTQEFNESNYVLTSDKMEGDSNRISGSQYSEYNHLSNAEKAMGRSLGHLSKKCGKKDIDNILEIMKQPSFNPQRFLSTFETAKECNNLISADIRTVFDKHGFRKITLTDKEDTGIYYDVYIRSPVEVIRSQIRSSSSQSTIFNVATAAFDENESFNHPMMSELGQHGAEAVKKEIIDNKDTKVIWKVPSESGEMSFVGMLQIYSDKSKTSLKESAFVFHPLHLTLLNFSQSYRRENIVSGKTFVGFLPVKFQRMDNDKECIEKIMSREVRLRLIHETLQLVLEELRAACYVGFRCVDADGIIRRCHPCIASYCCDIPEGKDMSSVKNGNSSVRNCHRCVAPTKQFHLYSNYRLRNGTETALLIKKALELKRSGKNQQAKEVLKSHSLSDQLPWILGFPFVGIHPTLDLHIIFTFEPLHNLHLGISKELKRLISERLKADDLYSASFLTKAGNERSFKSLRATILNGINRMLSHIQSTAPAKGLYVDFSNSSKDDDGNGLYGDEGRLLGMLEGKDYRSIDMVFPFIGMMVDRCCKEDINATTTSVCVKYVNIINFLFCSIEDSGWNEVKLNRLEKMIQDFKSTTVQLYSKYHASKLNTEKFHLLDHIVQDIRRLGGLKWGDAGLFEYAHTMVKSAYRKGSKRKTSAMDETMSNFMHEIHIPVDTNGSSQMSLTTRSLRSKVQRRSAKQSDSAALVRKGKVFTLNQLEKCRSVLRKKRKAKELGNNHDVSRFERAWRAFDDTVKKIIVDVGENGTRILCKLLDDEIKQNGRTEYEYRLTRVISGYVAGRKPPSSSNYNEDKTDIIMKEPSTRFWQRFVSGRGFYNNNALRQDCVLIAHQSDQEGTESLWVGKVLLLCRIKPTIRKLDEPSAENQDGGDEDSEYAFVQYFDTEAPLDKIDDVLECIRLSWAKASEMDKEVDEVTEENEEAEKHSRWYDFIPIKALRGVVHVVRGDYGFNQRGIHKEMNSVPWHKQYFYVNRFYQDHE